jgi:hypothetical protein
MDWIPDPMKPEAHIEPKHRGNLDDANERNVECVEALQPIQC